MQFSVTDDARNEALDHLIVQVFPLDVSFRLGPFVTSKGAPIGNVKIEIGLNATSYEGTTGSDGWVEIEVKWVDLVPPVEVRSQKKGLKTLEFTLELDEEDNPQGDIPVMERSSRPDEAG